MGRAQSVCFYDSVDSFATCAFKFAKKLYLIITLIHSSGKPKAIVNLFHKFFEME